MRTKKRWLSLMLAAVLAFSNLSGSYMTVLAAEGDAIEEVNEEGEVAEETEDVVDETSEDSETEDEVDENTGDEQETEDEEDETTGDEQETEDEVDETEDETTGDEQGTEDQTDEKETEVEDEAEESEITISYTVNDEAYGYIEGEDETFESAEDEAEIKGATAVANEGYEFVNWTDADGEEVGTEELFVPSEKVTAEYTANFEAVEAEAVFAAPMFFSLLRIRQDTLDVTINKSGSDSEEPVIETATVTEGVIKDIVPEIEGYTFEYAKVGSTTIYAVAVDENEENKIYVTTEPDQLTGVLVKESDIVLYYTKVIEEVNVTYAVKVNDGNEIKVDEATLLAKEGNVVHTRIIGATKAAKDTNKDFSFTFSVKEGYSVKKVSVNDKTIVSDQYGIYTVSSSDITDNLKVLIELKEKTDYKFYFNGSNTILTMNGEERYSTASTGETVAPISFQATEKLTFTLMGWHEWANVSKALNKLSFKYGSESPVSIAIPTIVGDSKTTTLANGVTVQVTKDEIRLVQGRSEVKNGNDYKSSYEIPKYTVVVKAPAGSEIHSDITIATNYKRYDSAEVWPIQLTGVKPIKVFYYDGGDKNKVLDPQNYDFINIDTSKEAKVYIKVDTEAGFDENTEPIVSVFFDGVEKSVKLTKSDKDGYDYYFTIAKNEPAKDIRIYVTAERVIKLYAARYVYDGGMNADGNSTDTVIDLEYTNSKLENFTVTDKKSALPTREGYEFVGWELDNEVYDEANKKVYTVNETNKVESTVFNQATAKYEYVFTAVWKPIDEGDGTPYTVNVVLEGINDEKPFPITEYGPANKTAIIIKAKLADKVKEVAGDKVPDNWKDYYSISENQTYSVEVKPDGNSEITVKYYHNRYNVTIQANSDEVTYDGTAHEVTGVTITDLSHDYLTIKNQDVISAYGARTDAGATNVVVKLQNEEKKATAEGYNAKTIGLNIGDKNDANYDLSKYTTVYIKYGTLTINKRNVTLHSADLEKVYDGKALVNGNNALAVEEGWVDGEGATYTFTGSQREVGSSKNTFTYEAKAGTDLDNYKITKVEGTLTVSEKGEVVVTITEKSGNYVYDGTEKKVEGYDVSISDPLYTEDDFTFSGSAVVTGTDVGTYNMNLKETDFSNTNRNFKDVTFVIVDGTLEITPVENVVVTITEKSGSYTYDGEVKKVEGYDVSINNGLYTENDFTFSGSAVVTGTDAGTYDMLVKATDFANTNEDFKDVTFIIVDGTLTISQRALTMTSATASKTYDGTALVAREVEETEDGFVNGEGVDYTVTGSQREVGSSKNTFTYEAKAGTDLDNYKITKVEGTLTVSEKGEVVVTITEKSGNYVYDGTEKKVEGYDVSISDPLYTEDDFTFSGSAVVTGTDVGTYNMNLKETDFSNTNRNFKDVTFVIVDGTLEITPVENVVVTITEKSGSYTYDGEVKKVEGYDVSINNELYTENDFTFSGSAVVTGTDAGTYDMLVKATDFANTNENFKDVTFIIVDGQLVINPIETAWVVNIVGNTGTEMYDGTAKTVVGYDVEIVSTEESPVEGAPVYTVNDFSYSGTAKVERTNVESYPMGLKSADFKNINKNFSNVTFNVTDGNLTITPREVIITSGSASKTYDGKALTNGNMDVTISGDGFAEGESVNYNFTGSQTAVGSSANSFEVVWDAEASERNYIVTTEFGTLTVNPVPSNDDDDDDDTPDPEPTPDEPVVIIEDNPIPLADEAVIIEDNPVPLADGAAVLGANRERDDDYYGVLGKRRRPNTGDSMAIYMWLSAFGGSFATAATALTKLRKKKKEEE